MKRENIKIANKIEEKLSNLEKILDGSSFLPINEEEYHFEFVENYGDFTGRIKIPKEYNEILKACLIPIIGELKEQIEKID